MNEIDYKTAYETVLIANGMLEKENKRLNNIIDKAIEYIKIYLEDEESKIIIYRWNFGQLNYKKIALEPLLEILGDKE